MGAFLMQSEAGKPLFAYEVKVPLYAWRAMSPHQRDGQTVVAVAAAQTEARNKFGSAYSTGNLGVRHRRGEGWHQIVVQVQMEPAVIEKEELVIDSGNLHLQGDVVPAPRN